MAEDGPALEIGVPHIGKFYLFMLGEWVIPVMGVSLMILKKVIVFFDHLCLRLDGGR